MGRARVRPRRAKRRNRIWLLLLAATVALVAALGPPAYALWSATAIAGKVTLQEAAVGLAVTKSAQTVVSAGGEAVAFTIGQDEAAALVAAGPDNNGLWGVAVPFDITLLSSARLGLDYAVTIGSPGQGVLFGLPAAELVLFPLDESASCTVADARAATPYAGGPVTGLAPGTNAARTSVINWCLAVLVDNPVYTNVATATGTTPAGGTASSQPDQDSTWWSYVLPDPAAEPNLTVSVTPTVTNPA